jgi:hypothetical protein
MKGAVVDFNRQHCGGNASCATHCHMYKKKVVLLNIYLGGNM